VNDQLAAFDESQQLFRHLGEARLFGEPRAREAVHRDGALFDVALGIEVAVEMGLVGRRFQQLDAADFDDAMAPVDFRPVVSVSRTI